MYKLENFTSDSSISFLGLLKTKWDEIHKDTDVFRYKVDKLEERIVNGKYLVQLNPDRRSKRRPPEAMDSICQPFDEKKFNFNKVSPKEILFSIEGKEADIHSILVNVSPVSRYHALLCPSVNKCLPQVVTPESLGLAVQIMFLMEDRDIRIGFNSIGALASVNHLHYHFFVDSNILYVENVKWQHIKGPIYCLGDNYPVPAFCFEIQKQSSAQTLEEVWKMLEYFLKKSIAHNIFITKRRLEGKEDEVDIIIWPRKSTSGAKQMAAFNIAVLELTGWFPIYDAEDFKNLRATDLEKELLKWAIEDFENICKDIKGLGVQ